MAGEAEDVTEVAGNIFAIFDPPPGDWRIRLARADDYNKKWVPHGILLLPEAGMDQIQARFGGGKYRGQLIDVNNAIHGTREFSLPGPYNPPTGPLPGIGAGAVSPAAPSANGTQRVGTIGDGGDVSPSQALNVALVDSVIGLMKTMKEPAPRGPTMDWTPIITGATTLLTTIVTHLLMPKKDNGNAILLEQLRAMQDEIAKLRDRPGPAANAVTDALAGIERIVKVSNQIRDMGSTPEGESSLWSTLAKEGIGILARAQQQQQPQPQALPAPAPTGAPAPVSTLPMWQQLLLSQRPRLLDAAMRGLDPDMIADFAAQMMPEQHVGVLTEFLQRPDAATVAQQVIPELTNFPKWTETLIERLRIVMLGGGEDEEAAEEVTG